MAELKCDDGTVVQISAETEAELRKAFEPKRVWEHGDVFRNHVGNWLYLKVRGEFIVVDLDDPIQGGTLEIQLRGDDVKFLFNIREKL